MDVTTKEQEAKSTFLLNLKQETAPMHERLEQSRLSKQLLKEDVSLNDYIIYLQKMRSVIAFTETQVFPSVAFLFTDLDERKKLHLIDADLKFFGQQFSLDAEGYHPFQNASTGFQLGYFYVVEGSTLGGRVILKYLQQKIGIGAENGGSFFAGYKETTGSKWKRFLDTFSHYAIEQHAQEEIISGAKNAFETINYHFES